MLTGSGVRWIARDPRLRARTYLVLANVSHTDIRPEFKPL